jgi:hypothetical protein
MHITLDETERAIAGYDDPGTERTPADNRIRALFWLVVMPMFYAGLGIIAWAVWTVIRGL